MTNDDHHRPTTSELAQLLQCDGADDAAARRHGIVNMDRALENVVNLAEAGFSLDVLRTIRDCFVTERRLISDADMALNNLERFVVASNNPLALASLFRRDQAALPVLLQLLSTSQHFCDLLIQEPSIFDLLRITDGRPVSREVLQEELWNKVRPISGDQEPVMNELRVFRRREMARIMFGDIIRSQRVDVVTRQISYLADVICHVALKAAVAQLTPRYGLPMSADGQSTQFVILALGKLGGCELNYSSDIDLAMVYSHEGNTNGPSTISNREYYDRLARRLIRSLTYTTNRGRCYRVDMRLRPDGIDAPLVTSRSAAMHYYDVKGRTWERQAFVKARAIAGDLCFGRQLLKDLEPWIFRRYLSQADIAGIARLRRKIENRTTSAGTNELDVKSGHGGIRDIEFAIQFLQLLNGGDLPEIRKGNTLEAIVALEAAGCLTMQERTILQDNYQFLRKLEHRLQIMFNRQTHELPSRDRELAKLAARMGYVSDTGQPALEQFRQDLRDCTSRNRRILNHLLHDAFPDTGESAPEVDLILDTDVPDELAESILAQYGFRDTPAAMRNLSALARERVPFLSPRRCRHFLAAISQRLLIAISQTPDPDATLLDLNRVSESVGGKSALWELFSCSQASLQLYVRMCAGSPYLSSILTINPGMIDELMDSLVIKHLPSGSHVSRALAELCRHAEDIQPILHSFKHSMHLQVGARDIIGNDDIRTTTGTLSDVAQACLQQVALWEYQRLIRKWGVPRVSSSYRTLSPNGDSNTVGLPPSDQSCELVILALGKLGGREPNYHSDLDVVFLYEGEGSTAHRTQSDSRQQPTTTNQHFFSELAKNIIRNITRSGPLGKLYAMDPRLRPTGTSGAIAVSFAEFSRYFADGEGQLWERLALCKSRAILGSTAARDEVIRRVRFILQTPAWLPEDATQIANMRFQMQANASSNNLKRAVGGTVDIEFIVQMLQLKHFSTSATIVPGTLAAISQLATAGLLSTSDSVYLSQAYEFLRRVESRLRLMNTTARHELPQHADKLSRLAYLMETTCEQLNERCDHYRQENRRRFLQIFRAHGARIAD